MLPRWQHRLIWVFLQVWPQAARPPPHDSTEPRAWPELATGICGGATVAPPSDLEFLCFP